MGTKNFPLRVVLTVTTGRLLTEPRGNRDNGIGDLYAILNHMTGDSAFTHQLARFMEECKPWLLRRFPELAKVDVAVLDQSMKDHGGAEGVKRWLDSLIAAGYRAEYDVPPIPKGSHEIKNPVEELGEMRGADEEVIVVQSK